MTTGVKLIRDHAVHIWTALILIATFLVYLPLWKNGFVSWDDHVYITNNQLVTSPFPDGVTQMFARSFEGHYHPFTLLSLKTDHALFGLDPVAFHLHNLLLHLANCLLVFLVFRLLSGRVLIAGVIALFFGIHPMHVESVAWATARKDVLFTFWFMLSWFTYLVHYRDKKKPLLWLSAAFALCSMLSKGQGVILPFVLVVTDWLMRRDLREKKLWVEKLPFFSVALIFGIIAIIVQQKTGYTAPENSNPSFFETFMVASYAFVLYVFKILIPVNLSAWYPYPAYTAGSYPPVMWLCLILVGLFCFFLVRAIFRWRIPAFGLLFFILNIFVFLKWMPVSNYIIADRYTYVAGIGIFLLFAWSADVVRQAGRPAALASGLVLAFMLWFYSMTAFSRVPVWKDSMSLLNDILGKYPDVYTALNARGAEYLAQGDRNAALRDFSRAIEIRPQFARAWANRGELMMRSGRASEALTDMNQAVALENNNPRYLNNRALLFESTGMVREAMADISKAVSIDPSQGKYYAFRAKLKNMSGDFKGALADLDAAAENGFITVATYYEAGLACYNLRDFGRSLQFFDQALKEQPGHPGAITYKSYALYNTGDFGRALEYLDLAISLQPDNPLPWAMRGQSHVKLGKLPEACADFRQAAKLGMKEAEVRVLKYCGQ